MIGTMLVYGRTLEITGVTISGGRIHLSAEPMPGPVPADPEARVTIFGSDGVGVMQTERFNLPGILRGETLVLTYHMKVVEIMDDSVVLQPDPN